MKLAFLGAGKMATAIAKGLLEKNVWPAEQMQAADISAAALAAFGAATGVRGMPPSATFAEAADVLLLAVKPQSAREAVTSVLPGCRNKLIISIAAGLPLQSLCHWFEHDRVVRVMPNTPAMVGCGAAVYCCAAGVTPQDRATVQRIFGAVGLVSELPEDQMDAVTALSGSGPAYIFEMIQALVDAAAAVGLPRETALQLTTQTVKGAAVMVEAGLGTPDELRDAVTSPGGTTAAGLAVMNKAGFRQIMANTVQAAKDRSVELGRS
jgi:pyrroline-5-carboxylate reductase